MKKKYQIIIVLVVLIFSYVFLFMKMTGPKQIDCVLDVEKENYKKKTEIIVKYKEDKIVDMRKKISFSSSIPQIINIKYEEYQKEKYKVRRLKNKIYASKKEKIKEDYNEVILSLTDSGYTCK